MWLVYISISKVSTSVKNLVMPSRVANWSQSSAKNYIKKIPKFSIVITERMKRSSHCKGSAVRIQYKCLVPFYVQKWKNETVQTPYCQNRITMFALPIPTLIYLWEIDIFHRIGLSNLLQPNIWTDHRHMNVEIGTEAAQFPEKLNINGTFIAVLTV